MSTDNTFVWTDELVKEFVNVRIHSGKTINDGRGLRNLLKQIIKK